MHISVARRVNIIGTKAKGRTFHRRLAKLPKLKNKTTPKRRIPLEHNVRLHIVPPIVHATTDTNSVGEVDYPLAHEDAQMFRGSRTCQAFA